MSGKEASRGFLYQAIASVLEALSYKNWDKIYIELDSEYDKVDIALEENKKITKSIQVKSTKNTFQKEAIMKCLMALIQDDVGAREIELILIGQCSTNAITLINAINKYQEGKLDEGARVALEKFDVAKLQGKKIEITCLPYEKDKLKQIVRDSLNKYISNNAQAINRMITYDQLDFIASAIISDQMISSIHGKGISRIDFDKKLEKCIFLLADQYISERISIGVISFFEDEKNLEKMQSYCSLLNMFSGRQLIDGFDWNTDIYQKLKKFLITNISAKQAYQILLTTHTSIAFAVGRLLNSKTGMNVFPMQKTTSGTVLWDVKLSSNKEYSTWNISCDILNENQYDSALILNVTRNIYDDVVYYIKDNNLPIGKLMHCTLNKNGATNISVEDGTHAALLANTVYEAVRQRSICEQRAILHIFAAAPNGFMFFLGQNSMGFGKCILYEFDFERSDSCTYSPSIKFINGTKD